MEKEREESQTEMKRRNDTIRALSKEMEDAKSLIKTLEHRGLTDEGIARLSPAAAAASVEASDATSSTASSSSITPTSATTTSASTSSGEWLKSCIK